MIQIITEGDVSAYETCQNIEVICITGIWWGMVDISTCIYLSMPLIYYMCMFIKSYLYLVETASAHLQLLNSLNGRKVRQSTFQLDSHSKYPKNFKTRIYMSL